MTAASPDITAEIVPDRGLPVVRLAAIAFAAAVVLFGVLALASAARTAFHRDLTLQSGYANTTEMAARAVGTRLQLLEARARAHQRAQAGSVEGRLFLRRLSALPDPLIDQITTVSERTRNYERLEILPSQAGPQTVLNFALDETDPQGPYISVVLVRDWFNQSLAAAQMPGALFVAITGDGYIASAYGSPTLAAALQLGNRIPMTLLAEANAFTAPDGGHSAPVPATRRGPSGKNIHFAAAAAGPGLIVALAAPAAPGLFSWRLELLPYSGLVLVFAGLGLALFASVLALARKLRTAQTQRAASDQLVELVLATPECGLWDWDVPGGRIFWSGPLLGMVGRPARGTWLTLPESYQLIHPSDVPQLERLRDILRNGGGHAETLLHLQDVNGRSIWCAAHFYTWPGAYERLVGMAYNATQFVEARKAAEDRTERIKSALEGSADALAIYTDQRTLFFANGRFREWLAVCHLREQTPSLDRFLLPLVAQGYQPVGETRLAPQAPVPGTYYLRKANGPRLRLTIGAFGEAGRFIQLTEEHNTLAAFRPAPDASDTTVLLHALEESQQELEALNQEYAAERTRALEAYRAKNEFLANMSHELKTPLNAIIGFSEIMQGELYGALGDARYRNYATDILNSGRELLSLIDDILEMAKIEAGRVELDLDSTDIAELVDVCVRMVEPTARDGGVRIENRITEPVDIEVDRRATKRIVMNLLSNAVKFTPRSGDITLMAETTATDFVLIVADTGIGIAPEDLERLGRPFEQVERHESRTRRGTGLGLAISKALAELQGGRIEIESVHGVGTTVRVSFPLPPARAGDDPQQALKRTG